MAKKHVGDVLGLGRSTARAPVKTKPGGRRPKGIEIRPSRPMKRASTVGGVRGRGR